MESYTSKVRMKTADLGGAASTTEFTDEVIRHVMNKLEVWSTLA
jgi:isocitrate dehydrogenase (NAD+)